MKYRVYTDGACDHITAIATTAYVVITDELFIGMGGQRFKGDNIALAETTAIALAFSYLKEKVELQKEDVIEVYSDSEAAISFLRGLLKRKNTSNHTNELIAAIHKDLLNFDATCHLTIHKVRAHKANMNPNKFADRIVKFLLRGDVPCLQS